jgi:AraC-like DNA-binding protein
LVEFLGIGIFLSLIVYIALSFISIHKYQKVIIHTQSIYANISLKWIQNLLYLFTGITVLGSIRNFYSFESPLVENIFYTILITSLLTFILTLIYRGLKQPELFNGISQEDEAIASSSKGSIQLEKNLIEEVVIKIHTRLNDNMDYLNPELDLQELALNIGFSKRVLSQVINTYFDSNFSEYINKFRVDEAKKQLVKSIQSGKKVLEIVYASGFNSKSNFLY